MCWYEEICCVFINTTAKIDFGNLTDVIAKKSLDTKIHRNYPSL